MNRNPRRKAAPAPAGRYPVYIRQWRIARGLSLRELAARMAAAHGGPLISYASLGRIERGLQPYSQPILEALADALDTEPGALISRPPPPGGGPEPRGLEPLWGRLNERQRAQIAAIAEALLRLG